MAKFEKGNRGGPGRVRGSRNRATLMREAITKAAGQDGLVAVLRAMMTKARGGDVPAARLMLPLLWPAGTFVKIELPTANDAAGIAAGQACLIGLASNEEISLEDGDRFSAMLENRRRALETVEIERNLRQTQENLAAREAADKEQRP